MAKQSIAQQKKEVGAIEKYRRALRRRMKWTEYRALMEDIKNDPREMKISVLDAKLRRLK